MTPLDYLKTQVGVTEATGKNDGVPAERYLGGEAGLAWCAALIVWAHEQPGCTPLPGNRWENRAVRTMSANLRKAGCMVPLSEIMPGDILVFLRGGGALHVGTAEIIHAGGIAIGTIEGNVGNACKRVRRMRREVLEAYRWPKN